jgi:hypothetical protein
MSMSLRYEPSSEPLDSQFSTVTSGTQEDFPSARSPEEAGADTRAELEKAETASQALQVLAMPHFRHSQMTGLRYSP